jgi:hypothetical protein
MSYSIRPARSRSRTKRGNILTKSRTCFESRKIVAASVTKFQSSQYLGGKKNTIFRFQASNENCDTLKNKGGSNMTHAIWNNEMKINEFVGEYPRWIVLEFQVVNVT